MHPTTHAERLYGRHVAPTLEADRRSEADFPLPARMQRVRLVRLLVCAIAEGLASGITLVCDSYGLRYTTAGDITTRVDPASRRFVNTYACPLGMLALNQPPASITQAVRDFVEGRGRESDDGQSELDRFTGSLITLDIAVRVLGVPLSALDQFVSGFDLNDSEEEVWASMMPGRWTPTHAFCYRLGLAVRRHYDRRGVVDATVPA